MTIRLTWRRVWIALAALALAALTFWLTAPYSISARIAHWEPFAHVLHGYMHNTVRMRTLGTAPPPQVDPADPALLRLGAGHFLTACATCHGGPGLLRSPIVRHMSPPPPPLTDPARNPQDLTTLHWIAYNGIKYTGMPGWAGEGRQDEVWSVAALVAALPGMAPETFRSLAFAGVPPEDVVAVPFGEPVGALSRFENCARCHGEDGQGRAGTAPRLAGQSAAYLRRALGLYASDLRQSGIMEPLAATLTAAERDELAARFAAMPAQRPGRTDAVTGDAARGAILARQGDSARQIGACLACHGVPGNPAPRIHGQHARFLANWLRLWRDGALTPGPDAARMAAAARGLTDQDIMDLSRYFAAAPAP